MNSFSFHEGERAVQARTGETAVAARNGTVVADSVIVGARGFIAKQFMVVLGSADDGGAVWSSVLFGAPDFLRADSGDAVSIAAPAAQRDLADPLWRHV